MQQSGSIRFSKLKIRKGKECWIGRCSRQSHEHLLTIVASNASTTTLSSIEICQSLGIFFSFSMLLSWIKMRIEWFNKESMTNNGSVTTYTLCLGKICSTTIFLLFAHCLCWPFDEILGGPFKYGDASWWLIYLRLRNNLFENTMSVNDWTKYLWCKKSIKFRQVFARWAEWKMKQSQS